MMLPDSNGKVKIPGQMTEASGIERGLRQGDPHYHHHHHFFSFRRSVQDYKIQMDMEIVTF
jgi:hypothetical protein